MIATLSFNGAILLALILIPLIYPEALPRQVSIFLMAAPPTPVPPTPPVQETARPTRAPLEMTGLELTMPRRIPNSIFIPSKPEPGQFDTVADWDPASSASNDATRIFRGHSVTPDVRQDVKGPVRVSSGVVEAMLLRKTIPTYPSIPRAAGIQGTVVLQATISKVGTIENLRVLSGPQLLQQAAMDAVKSWRYQPYLLDGEPTEVETTVSVIFSLGR
jgi:protein TonB